MAQKVMHDNVCNNGVKRVLCWLPDSVLRGMLTVCNAQLHLQHVWLYAREVS